MDHDGMLKRVEEHTGASGLAEQMDRVEACDDATLRRVMFGLGYCPAQVDLIAPNPEPMGSHRASRLARLHLPMKPELEELARKVVDDGRPINSVAAGAGKAYNTVLWAARRLRYQREAGVNNLHAFGALAVAVIVGS